MKSAPVGTVAELFAGVGGFRIALNESGFETIFSNQWEPATKAQHASSCYVANFGGEGHSNEDIAKVVESLSNGKDSIPKTDLIVGGFPCQDYSVAKTLNSSKGLEGKKGVLWWEIRRIVELNKPRVVFLENVDRLLKSPASQRGRDFAIMLKTLGDLGYVIEWRVVNAAEVGFTQRRIRVFIVAKRIESFPELKLDAKGLMNSQGVFARTFPIHEIQELTEIDLSESPEVLTQKFGRNLKESPFKNAGVYINGTAYTAKVSLLEPSAGTPIKTVLLKDSEVPEEYWIPEARLPEWEYLKGSKTIERTHKESGATFKYAEGKMAFPDLLENPARTIITGEGGSSPSRFKHVVKTKRGFRRLLPIELERLNGFPDNWTQFDENGNQISDVKRAFFMGNALVVGVVSSIGKTIAEDLKK